jgi:hypothetical protein
MYILWASSPSSPHSKLNVVFYIFVHGASEIELKDTIAKNALQSPL